MSNTQETNKETIVIVHDNDPIELDLTDDSQQTPNEGMDPRTLLFIIACVVAIVLTGALIGVVVGVVVTNS